jgi:hypothetical protein
MANVLNQVNIETGNIVEAYHVTQSIDAFTGIVAYNISLSGSFNMTGSINGEPSVINPLTASYAMNALSSSYALTASYALNALSSSYALTASHVPNTFVQNGNSFGTTARLGTNDSQPIVFETTNSQRMNISSTGTVGIGDGGNGTLFNLLNKTCTTSGSENTTLITLPTVAGVAYTVHAYVNGYGGVNGKIGGDVMGVFQNLGGTPTSAGSPLINQIEDFSGSPTFTLTISGTNIILQVTGQAATNITWAGHMKYIYYDANA